MEARSSSPPGGWYLNPENPEQYRYWDGSAWTSHVAPAVAEAAQAATSTAPPRSEASVAPPSASTTAAGAATAPPLQPQRGREVLLRLAPPEPLATLGWSTIVLLAVAGLLAAWGIVEAIDAYRAGQSAADAMRAGSFGEALVDRGTVFRLPAGIGMQPLLEVAIGIPFLIWFHRAYRNLQRRGFQLRFSTGWAIGGWFVPIFGMVRPKQIANDLWRAGNETASPELGLGLWESQRVEAVVHWWWGLWLGGGALLAAASALVGKGRHELIPDAATIQMAAVGQALAALAGLLLLGSALALGRIVWRVSAQQDAAGAAHVAGA